MKPADTTEQFLAAPVGSYVAGAGHLVWCFDAELQGTAMFGAPNEAAAQQLTRLWELDRALPNRFDVVIDGSRLERVDPAAFAVLAEYLQRRVPEYATRIRRQAVVFGSGVGGALFAGSLPALGAQYEYRLFDEARPAFDWLGRSEALAEVESLIDEAASHPEIRRALRQLLAGRPAATLEEAARTLGVSDRTLQRQLADAGTSFRAELQEARLQAARELLAGDEKIEAIARSLGYSTVAAFTSAFKEGCGRTPTEFRARLRGGKS